MNALWTPFLAVAVVFGVVAGSATWWHQRRFIADLKRRLEDTEQSRREMAEHLLAMRKRLEAADETGTPGDLEERRQALERALDLAAPAGEFPWLETMPSTPADPDDRHFQPTQPSTQRLDVNLEESAGR